MISAIKNGEAKHIPAGVAPNPSWLSKKIEPVAQWVFKRIIEPITGYFLKICVFKNAALQGRFSRWFIAPLCIGILNLWLKARNIPDRFTSFDPVRIARSNAFLAEFTEIRTAVTPDGTSIQWALFTPQKFQKWIEENGGVREGEWIRPRTEKDWGRLQRLREFKWFEECGHAFKIPAQLPGADKKCVLRCAGFGRSIAMDKGYVALHLAAGFSYAVFNWRQDLSIKGFYEDAETVYQAIRKEGYGPKEIKAVGSCRSTFPVARLKELHQKEGLDVVMIHPPLSLHSVIGHADWPSNKIGLSGIGAIEKDGEDFDNLRRFQKMEKGEAATCLILNEQDRTLPPNTIPEMTEAAQRVGPCEVIMEAKKEEGPDPHFGEPLRDPAILNRYFAFLNQSK